ncbi:hypothetical protein BB561_002137 [Smittium simulii]|uniref:B-related factor 1 n=1 Tax=Smittium simulii TaxID=133385 RepID=A0A2T9YRM3_9FUNG|nr:hypothetical protein BB561_002137 [Smittium simulii]
MPCASCGSNVVECDAASGTSFCASCGLVFEESTIVSELTFGENSSAHAPFRGAGGQGFNRPSKENTLYNAKLRLQAIATALKLPIHYVDSAQRYYHLALNQGFTRGRKSQIVSASCLYIVCRMEKSPQMLIDFSELLQANVFKMGVTFIRLVRTLNLVIPLIDPSLYIYRFSSMLDFEDKTQAVALDALRLVQRMDRDWIQTGRRPAGICGASLLIASRMHNFRRTERDIIEVVKVSDATLKKRLRDFKNTPTGQLSMANFRNIWLESSADPPAFTKSRFKSRRLSYNQKKLSYQELGQKLNENVEIENNEVVKYLISNYKKNIATNESKDNILSEIYKDSLYEEAQNLPRGIKSNSKSKLNTDEFDDDEVSETKPNNPIDKEIVFRVLRDEKMKYMSQEAKVDCDVDISKWTDIDDSEIENFLLGPDEIEKKTEIWTIANQEYLEKERFKDLLKDDSKPTIKPKNKKRKQRTALKSGENALESTKNMLVHKKLSKKINYEMLDSLFDLGKPRVKVEPGKITTIPVLSTKGSSVSLVSSASFNESKPKAFDLLETNLPRRLKGISDIPKTAEISDYRDSIITTNMKPELSSFQKSKNKHNGSLNNFPIIDNIEPNKKPPINHSAMKTTEESDPESRAALYSDLSVQKDENPEWYKECVEFWKTLLISCAERGLLCNSGIAHLESTQSAESTERNIYYSGNEALDFTCLDLKGLEAKFCIDADAPTSLQEILAIPLSQFIKEDSIGSSLGWIFNWMLAFSKTNSGSFIDSEKYVIVSLVKSIIASNNYHGMVISETDYNVIIKELKNCDKILTAYSDQNNSVVGLSSSLENVSNQINQLEGKVQDLQKSLKVALEKKQKTSALAKLKLVKHIESQVLPPRYKAFETLQGIISQLQKSASDAEHLNAIQQGTEALILLQKENKITPENITETFDDLTNVLADQNELENLMHSENTSLVSHISNEIDEGELAAELEKLCEIQQLEQKEKKVIKINSEPVSNQNFNISKTEKPKSSNKEIETKNPESTSKIRKDYEVVAELDKSDKTDRKIESDDECDIVEQMDKLAIFS